MRDGFVCGAMAPVTADYTVDRIPPQIGLDSKTPILIVLWKDAHAVGMFAVEAVLAFMIKGLALKVIGLANYIRV